ncbi:ribonuclease HIII [Verrucomicrobiaceae bacterium R5-34]|uniref:Ribonuclease n=1 Tax=Oceaniferula flava TaxID=2800421 RepID=A0AAE2VDD5_9BACT|nr:ribonuclease HIII [Oceaniferula flavus]MBK1830397.1 ribonuclease HIII [Verrucomicrobiaceae bacterium R5-34]MBK1854489.1 ribonuclease HIII [Oceaniferula flavus]MBM1135795.1 ribonuclease HIII [Oceaniferula flavus]
MSLHSYTSPIQVGDVEKIRRLLDDAGFEFSSKPYAHFSAKKGKLNVTVYEKGPKVLVQGKETEDFVKFTLEPEVLGEAKLGYEEVNQPEMFEPHFGIDESGKGDFFGPLVIAGAYTDAASTRALMDAGVMDSKRITSAAKIAKLATMIRQTRGVKYDVVSIGPESYNRLYGSFKNLNRLLAWGHSKVIANLAEMVPDCPRALSDQFARKEVLERELAKHGVNLELQQRTKGESDVAVAAASILARERFVQWMDQSSEKSGVKIPLGAGPHVLEAARALIAAHGEEILPKVAKMHFKTAQEV